VSQDDRNGVLDEITKQGRAREMSDKQSTGKPGSTTRPVGRARRAGTGAGQTRLSLGRVVPIAVTAGVIVALAVIVRAVLTPAPAAAPATLSTRGNCRATASSPAAPRQCAPPFTLADYRGKTVSLAQYRGHPVLINFWGVDCPTCAGELPSLKIFAAAFVKKGGVVLGVNTWHETPAYIASYAAAKQVPWPLLPDEPSTTGDRYGVTGTPTNVFVDAHGVIRAVVAGPLTVAQFEQNVQLL